MVSAAPFDELAFASDRRLHESPGTSSLRNQHNRDAVMPVQRVSVTQTTRSITKVHAQLCEFDETASVRVARGRSFTGRAGRVPAAVDVLLAPDGDGRCSGAGEGGSQRDAANRGDGGGGS
jgi:hypothetical protein